MAKTDTTLAVILAAGSGRKAWPYSATRNKAVFPVGTRPLIQHTVEALETCGADRIAVVVGYRKEQVRHALRGKSVEWVHQPQVAGTASALVAALEPEKIANAQRVLVVYGDVLLTAADLSRLLQEECAALVLPLGKEDSRDWLCARVQKGRIVGVLGHPRADVTHRFAGAFVFPVDRLRPYFETNYGRMQAVEVGQMPPDEAHLEDSLAEAVAEGMAVAAVEAEGLVVDIDKPWQLMQANYEFALHTTAPLQQNVLAAGAEIDPTARVEGFVRLGENSRIGPGCIIKGNLIVGRDTEITDGAIIEENCLIGDRCLIRRGRQIEKGSVIGHDCVIGHGAEFSGLMMDRTYFYHYGEYWGVLGAACDLGAATVCGNLRFDDDQTVHRVLGRRERPNWAANAAYLGDYVRTGVNAILMPGVKVGPYSIIGAGTIAAGDIPERSRIWVEQSIQRKSWGPERYGW